MYWKKKQIIAIQTKSPMNIKILSIIQAHFPWRITKSYELF
jgi:hypothetical protein